MLLTSILFFTLGTALCAPVAKDFTVLFAGRSLQGIGGGGIMTMGQVIYADIVPLRQRPKYFSLVLGSWALGSVLGPLCGGLFAQHLSWRWCFYANFPFCLFGFIFVPIYVKLSTEKTSVLAKLGRVDWLGATLFIGSMTSFLVGLSWAGVQYEWTSVPVVAPMAVGAVGVALSLVWERFGAREPFLRPSLFHSPSAVAAYLCAWCQGFLLFCALYYIPFYFMSVRFADATQSGINIFPVTCLLLPGSILVSYLTSRLGRFRWAIWTGWVITVVGCGLLVLLDQDTSIPLWAGILSLFGVGNGMVLTSVNVGIQAISRLEDCGRAASMYAFMRTLGMTIGVAVGGTVFQNVMAAELTARGLPAAIAHDAEAFVARLVALRPADPVRVGALLAYVRGFHAVFWAMTATAGLGLAAGLVIRRHSMDRILESKFTLDGGKGAALRGTVAVLEDRVDRLSRHLSAIPTRAAHRASSLLLGGGGDAFRGSMLNPLSARGGRLELADGDGGVDTMALQPAPLRNLSHPTTFYSPDPGTSSALSASAITSPRSPRCVRTGAAPTTPPTPSYRRHANAPSLSMPFSSPHQPPLGRAPAPPRIVVRTPTLRSARRPEAQPAVPSAAPPAAPARRPSLSTMGSASTVGSVAQAPAVSYYVAPGGRKMPLDLSYPPPPVRAAKPLSFGSSVLSDEDMEELITVGAYL